MRGLFTYFVFGSWWVAICAASLGLLTWFEITNVWWNAPLFTFILGSTLVIYNLNMISGLKELREMGTDSERHHWCMEHETLMKITLGIGLALSAISVWFLNPVIWLLMTPLGFVALAYAAPMVKRNTAKIRIREIGLWKIFIIAIVWAGMTAILPAVNQFGLEQVLDGLSWRLATERAIFIIAITIPFDIRDLVNDAKKGVRTIPSTIGWKQSIILANGFLLLFGFLVYTRLGLGSNGLVCMAYLISTFLTMLVVSVANPNGSDMYCSFWVEGTMILQFAFVLGFVNPWG